MKGKRILSLILSFNFLFPTIVNAIQNKEIAAKKIMEIKNDAESIKDVKLCKENDKWYLDITSTSDYPVQYQILYREKNNAGEWNVVSVEENDSNWTKSTNNHLNYLVDITNLNIDFDNYMYAIKIKRNEEEREKNIIPIEDCDDYYILDVGEYNSELYKEKTTIFNSKKDVDKDKIWSLTLLNPIESTKEICVKVIDSKGNTFRPEVTLNNNNPKKIDVLPISVGYKPNQSYTLTVYDRCKKEYNFLMDFKIKKDVNENLLYDLFEKNKEKFNIDVIENPDKYGVQVLYTEIERDKDGVPKFTSYEFNVDEDRYFYPASSIKLSACVLSLEKLNNLNIEGLDMYSTVSIGSEGHGQTRESGYSIGSYIKSILLYSDNNAFSRLYEFLGQGYYNDTLLEHGFDHTKVLHRLSPCGSTRHTNPMTFYDQNGNSVYHQPMQYNEVSLNNKNLKNIVLGWREQKNFSYNNFTSVYDLQDMMKVVFFNDYMSEERKFNLTEEDRKFMQDYLGLTNHKYLLCGGSRDNLPEGIEMYNKYGLEYGHFIDNAYIKDNKTGKEYFLTAVIYSNENGMMDTTYEYYSVDLPFLRDVGKMIVDYNRGK